MIDKETGEEIKFCKDCRWVKGGWFSYRYAKCVRPSFLSFVTGKSEEEHYAETERMRGFSVLKDHCGPEAKFFEPKSRKERKIWEVSKKLDKE